MCGIVAYVGPERLDLSPALEKISHRGPDNASSLSLKHDDRNYVNFGHVRLSIMDLDPRSNQPYFKHSNYVLVFNGEIYNFKDLRRELLEKGVNFETTSDTEVLYELLIMHGKNAISMLNGMFAFLFYDIENEIILIGRDYLGIKPLYYHLTDAAMMISSEIKALSALPEANILVDSKCLNEFIKFGFLHEPKTGFRDVLKVQPGTILEVDLANNLHCIETGYEPIHSKVGQSIESSIVRELDLQLRADVDLGLFFSGGLDSSLIFALNKDLSALTVKENDKSVASSGLVSDFDYARRIAKEFNSDIEIVSIEKDDHLFLSEIDLLVKMTEEPIADFTGVSSYKISRKAQQLGFKVMLSGMGADELYAGYPRYQFFLYARYFRVLFYILGPLLKNNRKYNKRYERAKTYFQEKDDFKRYIGLFSPFSLEEQKDILRTEYKDLEYLKDLKNYWDSAPSSNFSKMLFLDRMGFLSHNFLVADKSSMNASIELRVPLAVDYLFCHNLNLKKSVHIDLFHRKKILRKILLKHLPGKYVNRPKRGFHPPLDEIIIELGQNKVNELLSKEKFQKYFNIERVQKIVQDHFQLKENNTIKIYRLIFISKWLEYYERT